MRTAQRLGTAGCSVFLPVRLTRRKSCPKPGSERGPEGRRGGRSPAPIALPALAGQSPRVSLHAVVFPAPSYSASASRDRCPFLLPSLAREDIGLSPSDPSSAVVTPPHVLGDFLGHVCDRHSHRVMNSLEARKVALPCPQHVLWGPGTAVCGRSCSSDARPVRTGPRLSQTGFLCSEPRNL